MMRSDTEQSHQAFHFPNTIRRPHPTAREERKVDNLGGWIQLSDDTGLSTTRY